MRALAIHRTTMHRTAMPAALLCGAILWSACGVEDRRDQAGYRSASAAAPESEIASDDTQPFSWPEGPREVAVLEIAGYGEVHIALYPELAPETVAAFKRLTSDGYYVGTTFHRVIPGFMIQAGDPNTKDSDPSNDGMGGPGYHLPDEFSRAPHTRGTVSMANTGQRDSAGSQFFIVQKDNPGLDGKYSVFGRVIDGMAVVDGITEVERDETGRWGPENRPIENVVIQSVEVSEERQG